MEKPKGRFVPKTGDYVPNTPNPKEMDSLLFMKTPEAQAKYSAPEGTHASFIGEWDEVTHTPSPRRIITEADLAQIIKSGGQVRRDDLLQIAEGETYPASLIVEQFNKMGLSYDNFMNMNEKRKRAMHVELRQRIRKLATEKAELQAEDAVLSIKERICEIWLKPLVMEKPQGSSLHHFMQHIKEIRDRNNDIRPSDFAELVNSEFQLFVVEHDWAKAFGGSGDFGEGEIQMPFDFTCFEMRISGMRVLVMVCGENRVTLVVLGLDGQWMGSPHRMEMDGTLIPREPDVPEGVKPFLALLRAQIRAVCIMLDAEVAETELRRAPEKLNRQRERQGRTPLRDYHVVRLAHRHRVRAAETRAHDEPGTRKRLHFRRGHDRHYPNYKVWIKWQLVGDPDLGFVDKEYRL